jgi:cytochrome b561
LAQVVVRWLIQIKMESPEVAEQVEQLGQHLAEMVHLAFALR